jgi:hypothetical protein
MQVYLLPNLLSKFMMLAASFLTSMSESSVGCSLQMQDPN